MFNSPAGGSGELFPSPATGHTDTGGGDGGGSGDGLSVGQVQALIDTSRAGAVQPSSITTSGAMKSSTAFSFDLGDDGEVSKIGR